MKKILLISLLSSLRLLGSETIIVSGGAHATLQSVHHQEIDEAYIIVRGGSKVVCSTVDDLRTELNGGSALELPHPAHDTHLDDIALINNQPARFINGVRNTVNLAQATQRVKIVVQGGSTLYLPKRIRRVDLKMDGGSKVKIIKDINNLDIRNVQNGAAIHYDQLGTILYRIKKSPLVIANSITQLLNKWLPSKKPRIKPQNPNARPPVFDVSHYWKKMD